MFKFKDITIEIIVTCFFVGRIKWASGTFGSLLAFPLSYFIVSRTMFSDFRLNIHGYTPQELDLLTVMATMSAAVVILFIAGTICSSIYVKMTGIEDPKEVVIDEVVGQMIVIAWSSFSVIFAHNSYLDAKFGGDVVNICFYFFLPFVLFRACDIFKPWPIDWLDENIHGGIGIMLDDVLAAIFAVVLQYALTFMMIG